MYGRQQADFNEKTVDESFSESLTPTRAAQLKLRSMNVER